MCSSYPAHKNTYLSASSCPIPTQLGTHHLPMYADPLALLSAVPKGCRNQNMDIHEHPLPGPISQKRVRRFSPFFAHRSFTILPTGVPIFSAKFRAHVSSNSLFHESRWAVGRWDNTTSHHRLGRYEQLPAGRTIHPRIESKQHGDT